MLFRTISCSISESPLHFNFFYQCKAILHYHIFIYTAAAKAHQAPQAEDAAGDPPLHQGVPGEDQSPDSQPHQGLRLPAQAGPPPG